VKYDVGTYVLSPPTPEEKAAILDVMTKVVEDLNK
jgi:peptidyl-tRNA hydrolase